MGKSILYFVFVVFALFLGGCSNSLSVELPENPLKLENYVDNGYRAFDYNGRTYIAFAHLNQNVPKNEIHDCVGYLLRDGVEHDDEWIIRLKVFENEDILMIYYPNGVGLMDLPFLYRAIDTKGQSLAFPDYLAFDWVYGYWQ